MLDENGLLLLDAISMRLQAIGENVKKIEKNIQIFSTQNFISTPHPLLGLEILFHIIMKNRLRNHF